MRYIRSYSVSGPEVDSQSQRPLLQIKQLPPTLLSQSRKSPCMTLLLLKFVGNSLRARRGIPRTGELRCRKICMLSESFRFVRSRPVSLAMLDSGVNSEDEISYIHRHRLQAGVRHTTILIPSIDWTVPKSSNNRAIRYPFLRRPLKLKFRMHYRTPWLSKFRVKNGTIT